MPNPIAGPMVRIEHIALNVPDPVAAAKWYAANLGMKILREGTPPTYTFFIADPGEHVMMELFHNEDYPMLEFAKISHMSLHLAFMIENIAATKENLIASGATMVEDITKTLSGDHVLMLRDPWGLAIQLVQRVKPMLAATGVRPEHLAVNVSDSRAKAKWFTENLGMKVMREGGAPTYGFFITDPKDHMMMEIYQNTDYPMLDFGKVSHMSIHFTSMVPDVAAIKDKLMPAGATLVEGITATPAGDQVLMLRDPWELPIQFVYRTKPMVK